MGRRTGERLTAVDASNLVFERDTQAYAVAMVALLDAAPWMSPDGTIDIEWLRAQLAPRVARIPRLNQRVETGRGGRRPVWVDHPADPRLHIREGSGVRGRAGVEALAARLIIDRLPRDRPLWDLTLVRVAPGAVAAGSASADHSASSARPDQVGLVLRIHHAIADGVGAIAIMAGLFDPGTSVASAPMPGSPTQQRRPVPERPPARRSAQVATGVRRTLAVLTGRVPTTCLLGPLSCERGVRLLDVDLTALRSGARTEGATVNDALLAAVAGGLRELRLARHESVESDLPVSVPVSLRGSSGDTSRASSPAPGGGGNRTGVMLVRLPLGDPDVRSRMATIATRTRLEKPAARAAGPLELTRAAWSTRLMDVLSRHQRLVASFVTNVPGPPTQLTLAGARVRQAWPVSILSGNVRLAVAAVSYAGRLQVSVISDALALPDAEVVAEAIQRGLDAVAGLAPALRPDAPAD